MIQILKMQQEDLDEVVALEAEIFSMPWSRAGFAASLTTGNGIFLVAKEDGKVVGYCGMTASIDEGEITNVAVAPAARRRGVGEALIQEMICEGGRRGITRIVLEVRVSNEGAIRLYEKNGFVWVGVRRGFYEKPREDAGIMVYGG